MGGGLVGVGIGNEGGANLGFWGGVLVGVAVTGLIGGVVEILVLRRVYGREHLVQLLGTYPVSLVVAGGVRIVFGANYRTLPPPLPGPFAVPAYPHPPHPPFIIPTPIVITSPAS